MTSAPLWIGTSWKMNKTLAEAVSYVTALAQVPVPSAIQPFILPPLTALATVRAALPEDSPVLVGAQNAHWEPRGSWTGEVSMRMVRDAGATLVEIGHSERREFFGETDATVALKMRACLDAGLLPLLCVGEPSQVRDEGRHLEFVTAQVSAAMVDVGGNEVENVLVAYEPVWAIGEKGRVAQREEIAPVMEALAGQLSTMSAGRGPRALLYGGSVNQGNAGGLLEDPNTQGLFVGRSAWEVEGFLDLISIGSRWASGRR